jgi:hypothetical protein
MGLASQPSLRNTHAANAAIIAKSPGHIAIA